MPLLTTLQNIMKLPNEIDEYLASRNFSENTRSNYHYDLVSLQAFFEDKSLTTENLELYKIQISNLSPAAQRRKISSANQYLLFLYQRQKVDQYFKIKQVVQKNIGIASIVCGMLCQSIGKNAVFIENTSIFGKKTE